MTLEIKKLESWSHQKEAWELEFERNPNVPELSHNTAAFTSVYTGRSAQYTE
jgi:hypothetical protein